MAQTQHITEQAPPQPNHAEAVARVALLQGEMDKIDGDFETLVGTYDGVTLKAIDAATDEYYTQHGDAMHDSHSALPKLSQFLRQQGIVPDALIDRYSLLEELEGKKTAAEKDLEAYVPEKAASVLGRLKRLENALDYDVVVDRIRNRVEGVCEEYEVSFVIGARKLLEAGEPFEYYQLNQIEAAVQEYQTRWAKNGFLPQSQSDAAPNFVDDPEAVQVPDTPEARRELIDKLFEAQQLRYRYRGFSSEFDKRSRQIIDDIKRLPSDEPEPAGDDLFYLRNMSYNDAFTAALRRPIARQLAGLPPHDFELDTESPAYRQLTERARAIDVDKALADMEIDGDLSQLPFELSPSELKHYLTGRLPGIAIDYIKRIEFRAMTDEENPKGAVLGQQVDLPEGGGAIIINTGSMPRLLAYYEKLTATAPANKKFNAADVLKTRVLGTIAHEFGHGLRAALPAGALKEWAEAVKADSTNISEYVKNSHDEAILSHDMEDFADSVDYFVNIPEVLEIISEPRYRALRKIYEDYGYPPDLKLRQISRIIGNDSMIRSGLTSKEAIKLLYLNHER